MNKNRRGLIKISNEFIEKDWDLIYIFFKDFRPTHIEFRHWKNNTWYYYGVSKLFKELKEAEAIPEYDVIFKRDKNNKLTYKITKLLKT